MAEEIDQIICAEIPDKELDPLAYKAVSQFMIHGPCGDCNLNSPCMKIGKCMKHFPKKYLSTTTIDENGFPIYRRREDGRTIVRNGIKIDNRFIVPYNRSLIVRYQGHINVEWRNKGHIVKYLFKYVAKGPDRATMVVEANSKSGCEQSTQQTNDHNKVQNYLACRYVLASEACWHIFDFPKHFRKPVVQRLYFHLENEQPVCFNENEYLPSVLQRVDPKATMFVQWMECNKRYRKGRSLTYVEYPGKYLWDSDKKTWGPRKHMVVVGRMVYAHPCSGERFYLRMLINVVKGATSFKHIPTVNGVVYNTYKEGCFHLGLLESDNEWHRSALDDAAIHQTGQQLRELFVTMLLFCEVSDVLNLWKEHWRDLSDDVLYSRRRVFNMPDLILNDSRVQS